MKGSISIRVGGPLGLELRRYSKRQKRSATEVTREALERYLAAAQLRAIREKIVPIALARGFVTDEDVFRAIS